MASKKTIKVDTIVNALMNKIISTSNVDMKAAYCVAIEEILHSSGNYHGFTYDTDYAKQVEYFNAGKGIQAMIDDGLLTEYDRVYILR